MKQKAIEKVDKMHEPKMPINLPNKLVDRKLKNGNSKIEIYIEIKNFLKMESNHYHQGMSLEH